MSNNKSSTLCECFCLCVTINKKNKVDNSHETGDFSAKRRKALGKLSLNTVESTVPLAQTLFSFPLMPCREMLIWRMSGKSWKNKK